MITLLTDFGTSDYFVPAVKGTILSLNPQARLIDISHDVPPQDIRFAAFTLNACFRDFPAGTVHLALVDPGVGTSRRVLAISAEGHLFVGPDNGIFSYVFARSKEIAVYEVTRHEWLRPMPSATFHGRDVFAPIAAQLDLGADVTSVGPRIFDFEKFDVSPPALDIATGEMIGEVIHIDHFGNCITSFSEVELAAGDADEQRAFRIGMHRVKQFGTHFAEGSNSGVLAYPGSAGFWEIGWRCASAAERLDVRRGTKVVLERDPDQSES